VPRDGHSTIAAQVPTSANDAATMVAARLIRAARKHAIVGRLLLLRRLIRYIKRPDRLRRKRMD